MSAWFHRNSEMVESKRWWLRAEVGAGAAALGAPERDVLTELFVDELSRPFEPRMEDRGFLGAMVELQVNRDGQSLR